MPDLLWRIDGTDLDGRTVRLERDRGEYLLWASNGVTTLDVAGLTGLRNACEALLAEEARRG